MPLRINLHGGPGSGKSTLAHSVLSMLKEHGINAEFVQEPAKLAAYRKTPVQEMMIQYRYLTQQIEAEYNWITSGVDVVVNESPVNLILFYANTLRNDLLKHKIKEKNLDIDLNTVYWEEPTDFLKYDFPIQVNLRGFPTYDSFRQLANSFNSVTTSIDFYVNRDVESYSEVGRYQSLEEAVALDTELMSFLNMNSIHEIGVVQMGDRMSVISALLNSSPILASKFTESEKYKGLNNVRSLAHLVREHTNRTASTDSGNVQ